MLSANPPGQTAPSQSNVVTDEQLVNQVKSDIQAALKGGQWILSSYAPYKEKPGYPGLTDLSPEEARLFIYEAKANNTVDQAVSIIKLLITKNCRICIIKYSNIFLFHCHIICSLFT